MHACIVGGGIAGLYCAWLLIKKGYTVQIFEKDRWGGRIMTETIEGVALNAGAGRFNASHKRLIRLLHELNITEFIPLNRGYRYVKDGKQTDFPCYDIIRRFITQVKSSNDVTMEMLMKNHLSPSVVDDVIYAFGYNTEFENMKSTEAFRLFKHDFMSKIQYYTLEGGLERIIDVLKSRLPKDCLIKAKVDEVGEGYIISNNKRINCDHVFVCVTLDALSHIKGVGTIKGIGSSPLCRIYAGIKGFYNPVRTTTNGMIRYTIPINNEIIMASYTDGRYATIWSETKNPKEKLLVELKKLHPKIKGIRWIRIYYWPEGCHYSKPGQTFHIKTPHGVTICGEVVSKHNHGWIEGALETVETSIKKLT